MLTADIVVAGGGIIGTAAVSAIAKLAGLQRHRILLLESGPRKEIQLTEEYSNRVSALSPSTVNFLDRLGAWNTIQRVRCQPIRHMKVWESCSDAAIVFHEEDGGGGGALEEGPLAYLVENDLTVKSLTEVMESCNNVEVRYGAKVKCYSIPNLQDTEQAPKENVIVELENGDKIETQLLVGADGFKSLVRKTVQREEEYISWQYGQMGLVATLTVDTLDDNNTTAWQRFLPGGPVAVLPLNSRTSSLVWTVHTQDVPHLLKLSQQNFLSALNCALTSTAGEQTWALGLTRGVGALLGSGERPAPPTVTGVTNRAAFPLGFGHSPRYIGPRTVLVGDSAHRVHPLAGQGANLGFGDVRELAERVQDMVMDGAGLGHRDYLKQYETARQRHNVPSMLGIDGLQKLYSTALPPVVLARSLGLSVVASCSPLRKLIQAHAAS